MTNQASEDVRIIKDNDRIYQGLAHLHRQKHLKGGCFCTSEISGVYRVVLDEINVIIRTEKLKLLDRLSSHQEDLFWWTGGEYEKTKAVDMRAISAERDKLAKMEAEL